MTSTSPQTYLNFLDGTGQTVRQRFTAALRAELDRLPLPAHFDRQAMAERMTHAALDVFVDSDDHGLRVPGDPEDEI